MRIFRAVTVAALCVVVVLASGSLAHALWSDSGTAAPAPVQVGAVMFAAEEHIAPSREYSSAGGGTAQSLGTPVTVTMPGADIVQVLQGPTVWRFDVLGYALGIAGLSYTVEYTLPHDGTSQIDNVLEGTSVKVYPASAGGDCSNQPESAPMPVDGVVTIEDHVLQSPGTNLTGAEQRQIWCVALEWVSDPSQYHTNIVTAIATAEDGSVVDTTAIFNAYVDFPPSLDPIGTHTNVATVEGVGLDGVVARNHHAWMSVLFPDPSQEPELTFTLTPRVTTVE